MSYAWAYSPGYYRSPYPVPPLFEVVVPAADAAARRLVSVDVAMAMLGGEGFDETQVALLLDAASAAAATYCNLQRAGTLPPTFGRELLRATFSSDWCGRQNLMLPWRVPIASISITDGDAVLVENEDWQHYGSGLIGRRVGGMPAAWSGSGPIVVEYEAGWLLGLDASYGGDADPVPADIVALVVDQVRMQYLARGRDPALRAEAVPDVWSGTYNWAGGEGAVGSSGLLVTLEMALEPFKLPVV
jgi:hypothetical protein